MKSVPLLKGGATESDLYRIPRQAIVKYREIGPVRSGAAAQNNTNRLGSAASRDIFDVDAAFTAEYCSRQQFAGKRREADRPSTLFFSGDFEAIGEMEDQSKKVVNLNGGLRLRSARVAAGYVLGKDAAEALGVSVSRYRYAEAGYDRIGAKLLKGATATFGVSADFLVSGDLSGSEADAFAHRLSLLMPRALEEDLERCHRLRRMRIEAGFQNAAAAARAHGWKVPTFVGHEAGYFPTPGDRAIAYALTLRFRPEFMINGDLPERDGVPMPYQERSSAEPVLKPARHVPWYWARNMSRGKTRKITLLESGNEQLSLSSQGNAPLPDHLASLQGDKLFGVIEDSIEGKRVVVVAARAPANGEVGIAFQNGALRESSDIPTKVPDPLIAAFDGNAAVPLGTKVGSFYVGQDAG